MYGNAFLLQKAKHISWVIRGFWNKNEFINEVLNGRDSLRAVANSNDKPSCNNSLPSKPGKHPK